MTIRWVNNLLGTSPWTKDLDGNAFGVVDVRALRDGAGNSATLLREKITAVRLYLREKKPVVVCCDYGISRSNAIASAALAVEFGMCISQSLREVINATGERSIKLDFVEDVRRAIGLTRELGTSNKVFVLGRDRFVGESISNLICPDVTHESQLEDTTLVNNAVLLDAAMDERNADTLVFCWHPPALDTNRGAGQLIEALRNSLEVCRVRRAALVFLSGEQVFWGCTESVGTAITESSDPLPAGAAGDALSLCETLIKYYERRHGLRTLVIRPSRIYGAIDQHPSMLKTFIRKAFAGEDIVTHCYANGPALLDLIHIRDVACAVRLALIQKMTGVLHLVSGKSVATDDLARMIVRLAGSASNVCSIDLPVKHPFIPLQSSFAEPVLGWTPTVDLETGIIDLLSQFSRISKS